MARDKKTKGVASELPDLTPQQLEFVHGLLRGKTATTAYKEAYSTENQADGTVWANASRLKSNSKVIAWLNAARMESAKAASHDLDAHVAELDEAKRLCQETGNFGAMVNAIVSKGKALGLYVDQHKDVTERDPIEVLDELSRISPELAEAVAEQWKIAWKPEGETTH